MCMKVQAFSWGKLSNHKRIGSKKMRGEKGRERKRGEIAVNHSRTRVKKEAERRERVLWRGERETETEK